MSRQAWMIAAWIALAACEPPNRKGAGGDGASDASAGFGNAGFGGTFETSGAGGAAGVAGAGSAGCKREQRINAVVELDEPQPFDIVIVADHSQSLSWSRESLAEGLSTLLADARQHTARIFVLTPTQYGASSASAVNLSTGQELVRWREPGSNEAYEHAMTEYTQRCTDPAGVEITCPQYDPLNMTPLEVEGRWSFVMPEPIAAIEPGMSDAELAEQQVAVTDAILALSGTGSPNEQPLCTLNRYLMQNAAPLPAHAVFVVISDEDDQTSPSDCVTEFHYERYEVEQQFGERCTAASCELYQYQLYMNGLTEPLRFDCMPLDDLGNPIAEGSYERRGWLRGPQAVDCTAVAAEGPCGPGALEWAEPRCDDGYVVANCTASCTMEEITGCELRIEDNPIDFCTQPFEHEGTSYASLEAYCDATVGEQAWLRCERTGFNSAMSVNAGHTLTPLVAGASSQALVESFNQRALTQFGPGGYFSAVIGLHPDSECAPQAGQSLATILSGIASPAALFSICGDYSGALASVRAFTERLIDATLELSLLPDESVTAVYAEHEDGSRRLLDASLYTVDRAQGLLILVQGALAAMEIGVAVEVEDSCVLPPD